MPDLHVCLSPALIPQLQINLSECCVVVIDVLRATSSFSALFDKGIDAIVPVEDLEDLENFKKQKFLIAAERGGQKVPFADFGNSPTEFLKYNFENQQMAYSTTNGTKALNAVKNAKYIYTAGFNNINAVLKRIGKINNDILFLCSGWQNNACIEDTICAGAMISYLNINKNFIVGNDAALMAVELWENNKNNLFEFCSKGEHFKRLQKLGRNEDLEYCFKLNVSKSVPKYVDGKLVDDN